jgi:type III site-specific deoxyribonuclease
MRLERGLKHQDDAINSIVRVFENVELIRTSSITDNPCINLDSSEIIKNIKKIQDNNNISKDDRKNVGIINGYLNLDIKMETGTGKTFTQVKTIYELHDKYGFNKFIIIVPTLPIKAGTKQFVLSQDTKKFFSDEYNGVEIELRVVDRSVKKKGREYFPSTIREFATASNLNTKKIQVLLINSQLITNGKMLTKEYDTSILDDLTIPSEAIKSTNPVIIIDEPHKFDKGNITFQKIENLLNPQLLIRFGATFPILRTKGSKTERDYQNLLYNLTSITAFNDNLVKGVIAEYVPTTLKKDVKIKLLSIKDKSKCSIQKVENNNKKTFELEKGESLSVVHEDFDGVEIIGFTNNTVLLSNGVEIKINEELIPDSYSISYQDMMLETAIERHFEIEEENFKKGIKTLALFFIDDISSYRKIDDKPTYILDSFKNIFKTKLENKIQNMYECEYKHFLLESLNNIDKCHAGYFSQDNSSTSEEVESQVNDILNDKEKILKIKDNGIFNLRRFIFSKWTLKEGWDNPNIFTIAKLRSSGSENSKLQEVGRGLRLPVDNNLCRINNEQFYLNYIVDFTEKDFVSQLRNEVASESNGINKINPDIIRDICKLRNIEYTPFYIQLLTQEIIDPDGNILDEDKLYATCPELSNTLSRYKIFDRKEKDNKTLKVRKNSFEKIKKLWDILNQKYILSYSDFTSSEIECAVSNILKENNVFNDDEIRTERYSMNVSDGNVSTSEMSGFVLKTNKRMKYNEFLIKLSEITNFPINNLHNAFVEYSKGNIINKKDFNYTVLSKLYTEISDWKANELFKRFTYKKTDLPIHPTSLTDEGGNLKDIIVIGNVGTSKEDGTPQEKYLYDTIAYDSQIEKENIFEQIKEVTVFGKIPKNSVKIPVANGGTYSPDFMYVVEKQDGSTELNLVIESKNVDSNRSLRDVEQYKINCAEKLFNKLEKEGINIKYKKQLTNDKVSGIIHNILKDEETV